MKLRNIFKINREVIVTLSIIVFITIMSLGYAALSASVEVGATATSSPSGGSGNDMTVSLSCSTSSSTYVNILSKSSSVSQDSPSSGYATVKVSMDVLISAGSYGAQCTATINSKTASYQLARIESNSVVYKTLLSGGIAKNESTLSSTSGTGPVRNLYTVSNLDTRFVAIPTMSWNSMHLTPRGSNVIRLYIFNEIPISGMAWCPGVAIPCRVMRVSLNVNIIYWQTQTTAGSPPIEGPSYEADPPSGIDGPEIMPVYPYFSAGDYVSLKGGSNWYVTETSDTNKEYVTLLYDDSDKTFDIPTMAFDTTGSANYDKNSKNNIGYYLNNTLLPSIRDSITGAGGSDKGLDIRLARVEEINAIDKAQYLNKTNKNIEPVTSITKYNMWLMDKVSDTQVKCTNPTDSDSYTNGKTNYEGETCLANATNKKATPVITTLKSNVAKYVVK